jgi:hypothetical protein
MKNITLVVVLIFTSLISTVVLLALSIGVFAFKEPSYHETIKSKFEINIPKLKYGHAVHYDFDVGGVYCAYNNHKFTYFEIIGGYSEIPNIHDIPRDYPLFVYLSPSEKWNVIQDLMIELQKSNRPEIYVACESDKESHKFHRFPTHIEIRVAPEAEPNSSIYLIFKSDGSVIQQDEDKTYQFKSISDLSDQLNGRYVDEDNLSFFIRGSDGVTVSQILSYFSHLRYYCVSEVRYNLYLSLLDEDGIKKTDINRIKKNITANQLIDPTWTTPDFEGNVYLPSGS